MSERDDTPALVALCQCCNRVMLAIATQEQIDKSGKDIARAARDGLTIKTVTVSEARAMDWFCDRRRAKKEEKERAKSSQGSLL